MISYEPLFKTLHSKDKNLIYLESSIGFSSRVTAKFRKNERVSLDTIAKICALLNVPIEEVVEVVVRENNNNKLK